MFNKKAMAVCIVAAGLVLGSGAAANAGTTLQSYRLNLPVLSGPAGTPAQTKAISGSSVSMSDGRIASGYTANARECRNLIYDCGSVVYNVYPGNRLLPNSIPAGTAYVQAQISVNGTNFVAVSVSGYFASN